MIRVKNIFLPVSFDEQNLKKETAKKLKIKENMIQKIKINHKSLDARKNKEIHYVYEVDVLLKNEEKFLNKKKFPFVSITPLEEYTFSYPKNIKLTKRPIIIGAGPAGLFCSYLLAEAGLNPIIIERGEKVEEREKTVELFWKKGILNENSNVQFGEGGAGTFSDGKLNTLVKDKSFRMKKVFEIFISCGAPEEIMYIKNPHIGTDILKKVVKNMREKIIEMGGEFRFNTTLTDLIIEDGAIKGVILNETEKIECDNLVLAIGHSARKTFRMLHEKGLLMTNKPFAVGLRIIHKQEMINDNQYRNIKSINLGSASYKLTYNTKDKRGVYSFCMCPGGYVVNASSEKGRLAINGMSNYKRDSGFANSAIVVTVSSNDFGEEIFSGMNFQEKLEEKAYLLGNGNIPCQYFKDYKNNNTSLKKDNISSVKGNYSFCNLNELFPKYINTSLQEGIDNFGKKIPGFNSDDTILLGVESRTSSPIRIFRNDKLMSNVKGIYPCGEGAGYAGGITTSAMDGIKVFEEIINKII